MKAASSEVGGRVIEQAETELILRSTGYIQNLEQLKDVVVYADNGTPVLLGDVARVVEGPELRRGVVELNGEGEVVGGIVVMRDRENALNVIDGVKKKIEEVKPGLPEGVEVVTVYDRAPLIEGAVDYLAHKLIEEALVVALVCLMFLLHVRSAFVAIITLPLGVLGAFIVMAQQGITANIMSLGGIAIAIGAMVDASIVMVENAHRKLSEMPPTCTPADAPRRAVLAAKEVGPGLFFSLLIITVSFLPVFALTGQTYRLFAPLAYTKTYAMAFAAVLSVTLVPVLMLWLVRGRIRREWRTRSTGCSSALSADLLARAQGAVGHDRADAGGRCLGRRPLLGSERSSCRRSMRANCSTCRRHCPAYRSPRPRRSWRRPTG